MTTTKPATKKKKAPRVTAATVTDDQIRDMFSVRTGKRVRSELRTATSTPAGRALGRTRSTIRTMPTTKPATTTTKPVPMVTAATITDDQIRELRTATGWNGTNAERDQATITSALSRPDWMLFDANKREAARAKCADAFNLRFGAKKPARDRLPTRSKPVPTNRAIAAGEVLTKVFLAGKNFDLEHKIVEDPASVPVAETDSDGYVWVTVKLHVPALDIDMWIAGTHIDHPINQPDEEA